MCGRYIIEQQKKFERAVRLGRVRWEFHASYNVAPSQSVPVVRSADGMREGVMMRWGLIPFFARGVPPKYSTINATVEKLETAPAWRGPWKRGQRCIQLASGFYEWHLTGSGKKQPYFIRLKGEEVFGFASLWDRSVAEDGSAVESCAIITLPANELMREIHNADAHPGRMPAIVSVADFDSWLGDAAHAHALLQPFPSAAMLAHPVSPRVNSPRNNDAGLIAPVSDPSSADH